VIRLFAAIAIPSDIGELLAERQMFVDDARWRDLESLHVTLRFFGAVQENVARDLAAELEQAGGAAFDLRIEGAGCFGEGDRIRAIWAGLSPSEPLRRLAARCEAAARRVGLAPETRKFLPHVTLAYLRRPDEQEVAAWIGRNNLLKTPAFRVERFGLYSSWPGETGSRYELERYYRLVG
jgi:RNA 2',3'-cyclic 3'-phosphodiesterase